MSDLIDGFSFAASTVRQGFREFPPPPLNGLRELAARIGSNDGRPPPSSEELEAAWSRLIEWIESDREPHFLPMAVWKALPFLIWRRFRDRYVVSHDRLMTAIEAGPPASQERWAN